MKIDDNIRAVVRAAFKGQPSDSWMDRQERDRQAVAVLLKKDPNAARNVKRYTAALKSLERQRDAVLGRLKRGYGLDAGLRPVYPSEFKRAGGVPYSPRPRWKFEVVLTELAAAEPGELVKILAKYGIKWV